MLIITIHVTMIMQSFTDIGPPVKEAIGYTQTYANIIIITFLMINKAQRLLLRDKLTDKQKQENSPVLSFRFLV